LVLDGPLRSNARSGGDLAWSSHQAQPGYGFASSYDDARACSDGQRGRNTASPCFAPGYRSSQQQRRRHFGGYGRSRSTDAEGWQQQGWQRHQGQQYQDFRDRAGSMDWEDEEGNCGGEDDDEEGAWHEGDEDGADGGYGGAWCDGGGGALLEERRLEDMESLLGRILLHR
jgi:hypothetical protein